MAVIQHTNQVHAATCVNSEMTRQGAVADAIAAGGGSGTVAAAVRAVELAHYRRIVASCQANALPYGNFYQALRDLGASGY